MMKAETADRPASSAGVSLLLALICLATLAWPVREGVAQAPADSVVAPNLAELSLEQLMELPVLTIVTASKREQTTNQAPAQATVVSADDIQRYGYRTLADILRSAPGFYISTNRNYGFVGVRGFGRPGDYGGRVLLLMNGHRMNDPLYDTAAILDDFVLDVDLIDRVEIIRGPGSSLYGNNAFFAVVNVIAKRGSEPGGSNLAATGGTHEAWQGRVTASLSTAPGLELLVSASRSRNQGAPRFYLPEYDSPETGNGLIHGGEDAAAESYYASLRRGGLSLEAAHAARDKGNPLPQYGTIFGSSVRVSDRRSLLDGRYEGRLRDDLGVVVRGYYDAYSYGGNYQYSGADSGTAESVVVNRDESHLKSVGSELQLNWNPLRLHNLTLGAAYRFDFQESIRNFDIAPRADYLNLDREGRSYAGYFQDEFRPARALSLTAGLRYDHFDTFGGTVNPRLACVLSPDDATTVKLLYGTAFRAPNVSDFYYEDSARTFKLNPDLKSERIRTYEVVGERSIGRHWRGSAAVFLNTVRGLIDTAQDPVDSLYYSANLDRVSARGLELQVEGRLSRALQGRASYTLTRTRDGATDTTPVNSPTHLAKLNLTTPTPLPGVLAGWELQYMSERRAVDDQRLAAVWLVNATLFTRIRGDRLDVSLSAYNLLDRRYRDTNVSPTTVQQDGRILRAKVTARF